MQEIKNISDLENVILKLEEQKIIESQLLMRELKQSKTMLNPVNLIGDTLSKLAKNPNIQNDMINGVLSFVVGYASKKLTVGSSSNPIKQFFGTILQIGVSAVVNKNVDLVGLGKKFLANQSEKKSENE